MYGSGSALGIPARFTSTRMETRTYISRESCHETVKEMDMRRSVLLALLAIAVISSRIYAADAYIVRFNAPGRQSGNIAVQWFDDVLFFNTTETAAAVRLLCVSNGSMQADPPQL